MKLLQHNHKQQKAKQKAAAKVKQYALHLHATIEKKPNKCSTGP